MLNAAGTEEHDGRVGLVMECIDGRDLAEVVTSQGTLSAREAALIGFAIFSAIDVRTSGIDDIVFVDPTDPASEIVTAARVDEADLWGLV